MSSVVRIRDRSDEVPGGLRLLDTMNKVLEFRPDLADTRWAVAPGVWGYGEWVCALEDRSRTDGLPVVTTSEIQSALRRGEYFYDVRLTAAPPFSVTVGLFDSDFVFVEADTEFVEAVGAAFESVEIADG